MTSVLLTRLARCNVWAHTQLLQAVRNVSDEHYKAHAGLFFRSIHGTLNHILLADKIWYARLISAVDTDEYASNCEYWVKTEGQDPLDSTGSIWEEYTTDRKELEKKIIEQAKLWIPLVASEPDDLTLSSATLEQRRMDGTLVRRSKLECLIHIFNHATHHRGQISAAITRFGYKSPVLDLIACPPNYNPDEES
ncbi:2031_t:CDS:2 [Paraglomus brasilianum]|uniref:2031_t:CDS:1 n=1 Tax=Paraglomus brasilianum TaxID=144538 RepID=A0A9N8WDF9_9GLOM|nr:2031_t:CDS:2 [Paraglomus brasilianum]